MINDNSTGDSVTDRPYIYDQISDHEYSHITKIILFLYGIAYTILIDKTCHSDHHD